MPLSVFSEDKEMLAVGLVEDCTVGAANPGTHAGLLIEYRPDSRASQSRELSALGTSRSLT